MIPATEKRRQEARARGWVAASPLAIAAAALAGATLALGIAAPRASSRLLAFAERAFAGELDPGAALAGLAGRVASLALPALLSAFAAALLFGVVQTRALFTFGAFGWRRQPAPSLPLLAWVHAALLILVALAGMRGLASLWTSGAPLETISRMTLSSLRSFVNRALVLAAAAGLADLAWRRLRREQALAMTRGELEHERRELEGDPRLRAERRRRHRLLASGAPAPADDKT